MEIDRKTALTVARLREVLDYCPETGVFVWKVTRSFKAVAGAVAGSEYKATGYLRIQIDGTSYLAHRLAWLHHYGEWPTLDIDHINGEKSDNRIANLREATTSQNGQNQHRAQSDNKSGALGVYLDKNGRWRAVIAKDGLIYGLGAFDTKESAHAAYLSAKRELHEFGVIAQGVDGHLPARVRGRPIKARYTSRSGILGASFSKTAKRWKSDIRINGKKVLLGYFDTAEQAGEAYQSALSKLSANENGD